MMEGHENPARQAGDSVQRSVEGAAPCKQFRTIISPSPREKRKERIAGVISRCHRIARNSVSFFRPM